MIFLVILFVLICVLGYFAWGIFQDYERTSAQKEQRLFEIEQKARAVEIERDIRRKRQEKRAREIRRLGQGVAKLHREFPSYAPTGAKYREYNRVMAEIREQREADEDPPKYPTL